MRVLVVTDTHGVFNTVYTKYKDEIPEYEVVVMLGDHSTGDINRAMEEFNVPVYRLNGNHDMPTMMIHKDAFPLHAKRIGSLPSFTGWQGSHKYKESQVYGYTQEQSIKQFNNMPNADILFSHDGPYGYCGILEDPAHCGLKGILEYIKRCRPATVIFGHHHIFDHRDIHGVDCYCVYQLAWFEFDKNGKVVNYKTFEPV